MKPLPEREDDQYSGFSPFATLQFLMDQTQLEEEKGREGGREGEERKSSGINDKSLGNRQKPGNSLQRSASWDTEQGRRSTKNGTEGKQHC